MGAARTQRTRGVLLAVAVLVGAITALVPAAPAGAVDAVATTTAVTTSWTTARRNVTIGVRVTSATAPQPTGVVVISVDGVERVRAEVVPFGTSYSFVSATLELGAVSGAVITADYLGIEGYEPSTSTTTLTRTLDAGGRVTAVGTVGFGDGALAVDPASSFLGQTAASAYNPLTGLLYATLDSHVVVGDVEVDGVGTVGVAAQLSGTMGLRASTDGSIVGSVQLTTTSLRTTDAGVAWVASCAFGTTQVNLTGTFTANGIALTGTGAAPAPLAPTACGGRGDLVNATLGQPVTMDLELQGTFAVPPPPDTPTATTLTVSGSTFDIADQLVLSATVTGPPGLTPPGTVTFTRDGTVVGTAQVVGGVATTILPVPLTAGTFEFGASYAANPPLLGSSDVETTTIAPAPTGAPVSGTLAPGDTGIARLPSGIFTGGTPDPDTGEMAAGTFWFPQGTLLVPTPVGTATVTHRLVQTAPATGIVAEDNTVTFGPVTFRSESRRYNVSGFSGSLGTDCVNQPITATLTGTATPQGMHLEVIDTYFPPLPDGACAGYAATVNTTIGTTADLSFDVVGDFRRTKVGTTVGLTSWLPVIEESNQTLLVATVDPDDDTPTAGTMTFTDDGVELGTVAVSPTGIATLATALDQPGTRTITATYSGDTIHDPGTATTTVEVTPAPDGFAMDGSIDVGTLQLDITEGSRLQPQPGEPTAGADALTTALTTPGARLWFAPTTIRVRLGAYGTVDAEVRLIQDGTLTPATLGPDGTFQGLSGAFALQVRKVTRPDGTTTTPTGCVNVVLLRVDGQVRPDNAEVTTSGGGSARYPLPSCTGYGRAVIDRLAGVTVDLDATIDY